MSSSSSSPSNSLSDLDSLPLSLRPSVPLPVASPVPSPPPSPLAFLFDLPLLCTLRSHIVSFFHYLFSLHSRLFLLSDELRDRFLLSVSVSSRILLRGWLLLVIFSTLLSVLIFFAVVLYALFYASYMPSYLYEYPVLFDYSAVSPTAAVRLASDRQYWTRDHSLAEALSPARAPSRVLYPGQNYHFYLDFVLPDSPANRESGMIALSASIDSAENTSLASVKLSFLPKYSSFLVRSCYQLVFLFPLLSGLVDESQQVSLELFNDYQEPLDASSFSSSGASKPIAAHWVQISLTTANSHKFEFYSAKLRIQAHLRGLRYFMHHYYFTTACLFVSFIFFMEIFALLAVSLVLFIKFGGNWSSANSFAANSIQETKQEPLNHSSQDALDSSGSSNQQSDVHSSPIISESQSELAPWPSPAHSALPSSSVKLENEFKLDEPSVEQQPAEPIPALPASSSSEPVFSIDEESIQSGQTQLRRRILTSAE